jgi:hypothetical protein
MFVGGVSRKSNRDKITRVSIHVNLFPVILSACSTSEDGTDSVTKRHHIKLRRWIIAQKKEYNIQNMANIGNQKKTVRVT